MARFCAGDRCGFVDRPDSNLGMATAGGHLDLKDLKKAAKNAITGSVDQVLLGFQHSGLSKLAANLKEVPGAAGGVDLVARIGQTVLARAETVRSQLVATVWGSSGGVRTKKVRKTKVVSKKVAETKQKVKRNAARRRVGSAKSK